MDPGPVVTATDEVLSGQLGATLMAFMPNRMRPMVIGVASVGPNEIWCTGGALIAEPSTPRVEPVVRTTSRHVYSFAPTVEKASRASKTGG